MRGTSLPPSVERAVRREGEGHVERALVQLGEELAPQPGQHQAAAPARRMRDRAEEQGGVLEAEAQRGLVAPVDPGEQRRHPVGHRLPRQTIAASTGTRVTEKNSAPASAETTVFAIGAKMRPSTRWSRKMGR